MAVKITFFSSARVSSMTERHKKLLGTGHVNRWVLRKKIGWFRYSLQSLSNSHCKTDKQNN